MAYWMQAYALLVSLNDSINVFTCINLLSEINLETPSYLQVGTYFHCWQDI